MPSIFPISARSTRWPIAITAVSETAIVFANAFANVPSGTRHDVVRRQLGNLCCFFRTEVRTRIWWDGTGYLLHIFESGCRGFDSHTAYQI